MNSNLNPSIPAAAFLSNGRYFTFVTAAGTGQSRRHGHVVNRWLGDTVQDGYGQFVYLRNLETGDVWSVALQPMQRRGERYETFATPGQFHVLHEYRGILAEMDVAVSPTDELEVRRLRLSNTAGKSARIEVTSYFETVLTWQGADLGHPAFSKLFIQTQFDKKNGVLTAKRRPRSNDETWPVLFHSMTGGEVMQWETDRLRFLGRGRTAADPAAMGHGLTGTVGNVLDPCSSLGTVVELPAAGTKSLAFLTGIAGDSEEVVNTIQRYRSEGDIEKVFTNAQAAEQELRKTLGIGEAEAAHYQLLASAMHYGDKRLKPQVSGLSEEADANAVFGKHRIPRDRMQILVWGGWDQPAARQTLKARSYWNTKGFFTNLIVVTDSKAQPPKDLDDRVFTLSAQDVSEADRALFTAAASLVVEGELPKVECDSSPTPPEPLQRLSDARAAAASSEQESLRFFNGYGGFSGDGKEYVVRLPRQNGSEKHPPLPWINVIANRKAGFLVSESGAGSAWVRNSQANRLTPWSNDPVSDPHGEALYLRDDTTGEVWSPLPGPAPAPCEYEVRHGLGYSRFTSSFHGLDQEVLQFVPKEDPLKIIHVRVTNRSGAEKKLTLTSFQRLILGSQPEQPSLVVTSVEKDESLRARNLAAGDFRGGIAFGSAKVHGATVERSAFTCDRLAFLGRYGSPPQPAALRSGGALDGASGVGLDPCFVHQHSITLPPRATADWVILLGETMNAPDAEALVARYSNVEQVHNALKEARSFWEDLVGGLQIETPSQILNVLVNGWLVYQTLSCRMWGRTAFYQSSGAYGYRDQLQDSGSLLPLDPHFARSQILLHAAHQFTEGDVLHWWHPEPIGRGMRTRFSDDLLWLPLVTSDYIQATGDYSLLDERAPFISGPLLNQGEEEHYLKPELSSETADLYEHCCRSIDRSLMTGAHGLPLMGIGDWNDGMSRVGREGRGESVWMAFFLYDILGKFIPLCKRRGDTERAECYKEHRTALGAAINEGGWDGEWYRRAYYDSGQPLGSKLSDECRIDALAQAWAVISKAAPPKRADTAMKSMSRDLISEKEGLIRLLTPPFVNTPHDPGYIKGYVAGVRENGGQYTHAACWVVKAVAEHGENERALRLLEMLAPISHARNEEAADFYKVEPFAVAADIYGAAPHVGRGGWTWYTGAAGWMYRVAIESILGLRMEHGNTLVLHPCVPRDWGSFRVRYRRPGGADSYDIRVENPNHRVGGMTKVQLDDTSLPPMNGEVRIPLCMDEKSHTVSVWMD